MIAARTCPKTMPRQTQVLEVIKSKGRPMTASQVNKAMGLGRCAVAHSALGLLARKGRIKRHEPSKMYYLTGMESQLPVQTRIDALSEPDRAFMDAALRYYVVVARYNNLRLKDEPSEEEDRLARMLRWCEHEFERTGRQACKSAKRIQELLDAARRGADLDEESEPCPDCGDTDCSCEKVLTRTKDDVQ